MFRNDHVRVISKSRSWCIFALAVLKNPASIKLADLDEMAGAVISHNVLRFKE
jgi:hypothetical protein